MLITLTFYFLNALNDFKFVALKNIFLSIYISIHVIEMQLSFYNFCLIITENYLYPHPLNTA